MMCLFISQNTVNITFFTDHTARNFFLTCESLFPFHQLIFPLRLFEANLCLANL